MIIIDKRRPGCDAVREHFVIRVFSWQLGLGSRVFSHFRRGATHTERFTGWYLFLRPREWPYWPERSHRALMVWRGRKHRHRAVGEYGGFRQGIAAAEGANIGRAYAKLPDRDV